MWDFNGRSWLIERSIFEGATRSSCCSCLIWIYLVRPTVAAAWMKRVCVKIGLTLAIQPSCFFLDPLIWDTPKKDQSLPSWPVMTSDAQWCPVMTSILFKRLNQQPNQQPNQLSPLALSTMRCSVFLSARLADGLTSDSDVMATHSAWRRSLDAEPLGDVHCYSCNLIL